MIRNSDLTLSFQCWDCYYVVEISNGSVCAPVAGPVSGIEA